MLPVRKLPKWWPIAVVVACVVIGLGAWGLSSGGGSHKHKHHARHERGVPAAFQGVRWRRVALPPMCGFKHTIKTKGSPVFFSTQIVTRRVRPPWRGLTVEDIYRKLRPTYGALLGRRDDVAVMVVGCANTGGTADGFYQWNVVVYGRKDHRTVPFATLPTLVRVKQRELATVANVASVGRGRIVIREFFYGSGDRSCCSSGRAVTTWRLRHGVLVAHTVIVRLPRKGAAARTRMSRSDVLVAGGAVRLRR